jgi:hypothetical protein
MTQIVVYDKKSKGNPIVGIHAARSRQDQVSLEDVHAGADPARYGVLLVADDIVAQMTAHKYKRDRKGRLVMRPVLQDRSKELLTTADSALGENIIAFGEPYAKIRSVTNLSGKSAPFSEKHPAKGIIGLGERSGCFTVVCEVDTGQQAPEVVSEEKNWEWERDGAANIVGMRLLKTLSADTGQ